MDETAEELHAPAAEVRAALRRLDEAHVLVLGPAGGQIRMAMPFSATPTRFEVKALGHRWWAPCAWDALAIPAMLRCDATISTSCGDCEEQLHLSVESGVVKGNGEVIHFAVPAARWWDDIFFT